MNMLAFAVPLDDVVTSPQSLGAARNQRDFAVPGPPVAQSTFSLAMIREAFKGLLVTTERSFSSSAGQRDVLEHAIEHGRPLHGLPVAFQEETFSFKSVLDFELNGAISTTVTIIPVTNSNGSTTEKFTLEVSSH